MKKLSKKEQKKVVGGFDTGCNCGGKGYSNRGSNKAL